MKKIIIGTAVVSTMLFSSAATQKIDKMVDQIQKRRVGMELKELASTPDPFVVVNKDTNITTIDKPKKKDAKVSLGGIVNQKAHINGKWHKVGDDVAGYTLNYIGAKGVVLVDDTRIKRLFLHEEIEGIITTKEGM